MSQAISPQHPAVVLRSHYQYLRGLLVIASIAIVGLTVAVVILATHNRASTSRAATATQAAQTADTGATLDHRGLKTTRYDRRSEERTRGQ